MQEFVITLLFGWLGVHRFIKKRYTTGVLWLCTFGLCGCGWIYDTVKAYKHMKENKNISSGGGYCLPGNLLKVSIPL